MKVSWNTELLARFTTCYTPNSDEHQSSGSLHLLGLQYQYDCVLFSGARQFSRFFHYGGCDYSSIQSIQLHQHQRTLVLFLHFALTPCPLR